jgi:hypothetical protein
MIDLNDRLLAAHDRGDLLALVALYAEAAKCAKEEQARGFYLTHAYVYALELGSETALELRARLIDMGRETPL